MLIPKSWLQFSLSLSVWPWVSYASLSPLLCAPSEGRWGDTSVRQAQGTVSSLPIETKVVPVRSPWGAMSYIFIMDLFIYCPHYGLADSVGESVLTFHLVGSHSGPQAGLAAEANSSTLPTLPPPWFAFVGAVESFLWGDIFF